MDASNNVLFTISNFELGQNNMSIYIERAKKIVSAIEELASITEVPGVVTRTYGTATFAAAAQKVRGWMQQAGLQTWVDHCGNVRGRLQAAAGAKTLVLASHIDSVVNAGKFDGPLGVLTAIDLVENLVANKTVLPFNMEIIAFCDEEGVRFHTTYLGSRVVAGSFDERLLERTDKNGITLRQAMELLGGNAARLQEDALRQEELLGYFEMHIEQGPVLYESGIPVAVVTAIAGQKRIELTFTGVAGHAGTVPMPLRKDALCCAAECVAAIEDYATSCAGCLATVGKLVIPDAASNVIPGKVLCTLDVRTADLVTLNEACAVLQKTVTEICQKRSVHLQWTLVQESNPVSCSAALNGLLKEAIQASGHRVVELVSGAGHDAVPLSAITPVALLFVRCFEGISHHPRENVEVNDIAASIEVAERFIGALSSAIKHPEWKYPL
jgi:allantoate deiminase